jgi:hypothetical protein
MDGNTLSPDRAILGVLRDCVRSCKPAAYPVTPRNAKKHRLPLCSIQLNFAHVTHTLSYLTFKLHTHDWFFLTLLNAFQLYKS